MITLNDIAKMAGVSKSTVSRYLNKGSVSKQTREKLDEIIEKTGYQPNPFARSLKAEQSNMIGVIIPRYDSPSTNEVLKGIDAAANRSGIRLIIMSANLDSERTLQNIQTLQIQKVDSIILFGSYMNPSLETAIRQSHVPIILIGQNLTDVTCLNYDDYYAGQLIAQHALELGHQRLVFVGVSEEDQAVGVLRKKGFYDVANSHGASIDYIETTFSRSDTYEKALEFLPIIQGTYIAAATDYIAMGIMGAASQLNIRIPKDISLSGFGGYKAAKYMTPHLTTVNYPYFAMGEKAVEKALERLETTNKMDVTTLSVTMNSQQSTKRIKTK